ncbi:PREDICTED: uncharacterized protein LOC106742559 [Dinoponera quadriceps]|uniref:Uncharacterized protein LOC106742559 n=1 Tax=Dinoponera quadriceps TaxID=609295 RepID=A0A6P3WYC1_DINQU|nr:PREDICTED: uncharacterized protein LOC106742559 [Dinoponera quadriceps]
MRAEEKEAVKVTSTSFETDDTNNRTFKYHEQFQQVENFRIFSKILDKSECTNGEDKYLIKLTSSSKSIGTIGTEKISTASIEARKKSDVWEHKTISDTRNTIRRVERISWKYKNPHSLSICDRTRYEKSESDDILKKDEPQEGKMGRSILSDYREYLANHQESYRIPETKYSFAALITMMAQVTVQSLWALLYMFINIIPVIQMFSFILRFVLDQILNIRKTKDLRQMTVKFAVLAVQLLSIHVCLIFILGFIVFPIVQMAVSIAVKLVTSN